MKTIKTLIEIPAKYKWMTVDEDGIVVFWTSKPIVEIDLSPTMWVGHGSLIAWKINPPNDWTKAIWRIEEYDEI